MQKDYYNILSVTPAASQDEIKTAYEKMADKVSLSSLSEEALADVEEAYAILSNPEIRSQYDRLYKITAKSTGSFDGMDASKFGFRGLVSGLPQSIPVKNTGFEVGFDLDDLSEVNPEDFAEIIKRALSQVTDLARTASLAANPEENFRLGNDIYLDLIVEPKKALLGGYQAAEYHRYISCSACGGTGGNGCLKCQGQGRVLALRRVEVKLPKNVQEGAVLRITGEGHKGLHGLPEGDLLVKVLIKK